MDGLSHSCLQVDGDGLNLDGWEKVNNCMDDLLVVTLAFPNMTMKRRGTCLWLFREVMKA